MATYDVMLVTAAGLALVMVGIFASLWRSNIDGVREWLAANAVAVAAFPFFSVGWKYEAFLTLEIANALYGCTSLLTAAGFCRFYGRSPHYPRLLALLGLLFASLAYFHYAMDLPRMRIILVTLFHCAMGVYSLHILRQRSIGPVSPFSLAFAKWTALAVIAFAAVRLAMQVPYVRTNTLHLPVELDGPAMVFLSVGLFLLPALTLAGSSMATSRLVLLAREEAKTDFLTGAWSRRALIEFAERELERARRNSTPLSLLLIDIDDFKRINDNFGHPVGDAVLSELALKTSSAVRNIDYFCRMGGEEFAVLMPDTDVGAATEAAERLRIRLGETVSGSIHYTVSIGVAQDRGDGWAALYRAADKALNRAKQEGKNRVVAAQTAGSANLA